METTGLTPSTLSDRVREHPYQSLLIALGVGYILGGGLFTRLTLNMLRAGVRVATIPVIQGELVGLATTVLTRHPPASA